MEQLLCSESYTHFALRPFIMISLWFLQVLTQGPPLHGSSGPGLLGWAWCLEVLRVTVLFCSEVWKSLCLHNLVCSLTQLFAHNLERTRRRQWHPTPVLLPGKSHGQRSLVGCSPWGRSKSDTTEQLPFHFSLSRIGEGNGNPLQCSCLENPRDGEPGGLLSMGSHRVGHDCSDLA